MMQLVEERCTNSAALDTPTCSVEGKRNNSNSTDTTVTSVEGKRKNGVAVFVFILLFISLVVCFTFVSTGGIRQVQRIVDDQLRRDRNRQRLGGDDPSNERSFESSPVFDLNKSSTTIVSSSSSSYQEQPSSNQLEYTSIERRWLQSSGTGNNNNNNKKKKNQWKHNHKKNKKNQWKRNHNQKSAMFVGEQAVDVDVPSITNEDASISVLRIDVYDIIKNRVIIMGLTDNMIINLSTYGLTSPTELNFVAITSSATLSVTFGFDRKPIYRTESTQPFSLCGDSGIIPISYFPCLDLRINILHTISITPFSGLAATGVPGLQFIRRIQTITNGVIAPTPPKPVPAPIAVIPSPIAVSGGNSITRVEIINTVTNRVIGTLNDNAKINLWMYGLTVPKSLNFNVITGLQTMSVKFSFDLKLNFRIESSKPFSLCGDLDNIFLGCPYLVLEKVHTLSITPYTGVNATGAPGPMLTYRFVIVTERVDTPVAPLPLPLPTPIGKLPTPAPFRPIPTAGGGLSITSIEVYETITSTRVTTLTEGMILDLTSLQLPSITKLNFRVMIGSATTSVVIDFNGKVAFKIESILPFTSCGDTTMIDNTVTYWDCLKGPRFGLNTITAAPYTLASGAGTRGVPLTINFQIVQGSINSPIAVPTPPRPTPLLPTPIFMPPTPIIKPPTPIFKPPTLSPFRPNPTAGGDLSITSIEVYETITSTRVATLSEGMILDITSFRIPSITKMNFRVMIGSATTSVVIDFNGKAAFKIESILPFTSCGDTTMIDNTVKYWDCLKGPRLGLNTITATPYTLASGAGIKGVPMTIKFQIVQGQGPIPAPLPAPFMAPRPQLPLPAPFMAPRPQLPLPTMPTFAPYLVSGGVTIHHIEVFETIKSTKVATLTENMILDISSLGLTSISKLNFQVISGTGALSVVIDLNGKSAFKIESILPFTSCGDTIEGTRVTYWDCLTGTRFGLNTITASPYTLVSGKGIKGPPLTINFQIVQGPLTPNRAPVPLIPIPIRPAVPLPVPTVKLPTSAPVVYVPTFASGVRILRIEVYETVRGTKVATLLQNMILNISTLGLPSVSKLNFQVVAGSDALSVVIDLNGKPNFKTESVLPFTACGDMIVGTSIVYLDCFTGTRLGLNEITVTPYSMISGKGTTGPPLTVNFQIVQNAIPAPVFVPVKAPIALPIPVPVVPPIPPPVVTEECTVPKFEGDWIPYQSVPIPLAEAQGFVIGDDFVLVSGFTMNFNATVSRKVYALDLKIPGSIWRAMDDMPILNQVSGITHGGFVVIDKIVYICGGYAGSHPGPASKFCLQYNHVGARGTQWSYLPPLPLDRAGGALFHDKLRNTLYFGTGSSRPNPDDPIYTIDHHEAWSLNLRNIALGWKPIPDVPYMGNHVGFTTIKFRGIERHFSIGGQLGEDEHRGNLDFMYEWEPGNNRWVERAKLPVARGHFSSSVVPWKNCGFTISGGSTNLGKTSEVTYYDITTNTWIKIGDIPKKLNTPVCVLYGEYYYCQSGYINTPFSWKRKMI